MGHVVAGYIGYLYAELEIAEHGRNSMPFASFNGMAQSINYFVNYIHCALVIHSGVLDCLRILVGSILMKQIMRGRGKCYC